MTQTETTIGLDRETAKLLKSIEPEIRGAALLEVRHNFAHSNELLELGFDDGRTLVVKRGRHAWAAAHFEAARAASTLLRTRLGILAPRPIQLTCTATFQGRPLQAYWRIELPTLAELWPSLSADQQLGALRSWGTLLRRVHQLRPTGWGPVSGSSEVCASLSSFLTRDLHERLLPAMSASWPPGRSALQRLIELIPVVVRDLGDGPAVLVHGDMHMGNVLCRFDGDRVQCVGLLDLDNAHAAPAESDPASFEVLHGPFFEQPLDPRHVTALRQGYGEPLHPRALAFFRAAHLANQTFTSALLGHEEHAEKVGGVLEDEVDSLIAGAIAG